MVSQLKDRFVQYDNENPAVFLAYVKFAQQAKAAGRRILSIAMLTERIRWDLTIDTKSNDGFKISNNHAAFYARKLDKLPEFNGMFRLRPQKVVY